MSSSLEDRLNLLDDLPRIPLLGVILLSYLWFLSSLILLMFILMLSIATFLSHQYHTVFCCMSVQGYFETNSMALRTTTVLAGSQTSSLNFKPR